MKVRYKSPASIELTEAFDWYCGHSPSLGDKFLSAIDATVDRIRHLPHAARADANGVRSALVSGFPYALHYTVGNEEITVYAVAHLRRNPRYWKERLQ